MNAFVSLGSARPSHSNPSSVPPLDRMGDEIAELSARQDASEYRLLGLIREFDRRAGWKSRGQRSCAEWLSWRTGLSAGPAREKVRVARALGNLALLSDAMSRAEISYSKVRAVTRVATAENERQLLSIALGHSASEVERIVRAWRKDENGRYEERGLTVREQDGAFYLRGKLPPEVGRLLITALEAAREALEGKDLRVSAGTSSKKVTRRRRADCLRLLLESALSGGLDPGKCSDRYQVVVHVDGKVLEHAEGAGQSVLEPGVGVSAETSRRVACDASLVEVKHDERGEVLEVSCADESIPRAIRAALDRRDPTCRWPGCGLKVKQAHYLEHWADGGARKVQNLLNLCAPHHGFVHEGGFRAELLPDGKARFYRPDGGWIPDVPRPLRIMRFETPSGPPHSSNMQGAPGRRTQAPAEESVVPAAVNGR